MSKWETNKAAQLRKEYEDKLSNLQETCTHESISEWMPSYWAPGHLCPYDVQICEECNKEVHFKNWCDACGKELIDAESIPGDGTKDHPGGCTFCAECFSKPWDSDKRVARQTPSAFEEQHRKAINECVI